MPQYRGQSQRKTDTSIERCNSAAHWRTGLVSTQGTLKTFLLYVSALLYVAGEYRHNTHADIERCTQCIGCTALALQRCSVAALPFSRRVHTSQSFNEQNHRIGSQI